MDGLPIGHGVLMVVVFGRTSGLVGMVSPTILVLMLVLATEFFFGLTAGARMVL